MNPFARLPGIFRSLSARERFFVGLALVSLLLFAVVRWGAFPARDRYRKTMKAIPQRRELLAKYAMKSLGQERLDGMLAERRKRLGELEEGLLPGDNPAAAGAALQGLLKPLTNRPDTRVTSVRAMAPVAKGGYAEVAVQLDLQTSTEGLAKFLADVTRQKKILRVQRLTVSSGMYSAVMANRPDLLVVSVAVAGMSRGGEEKAKGEAP